MSRFSLGLKSTGLLALCAVIAGLPMLDATAQQGPGGAGARLADLQKAIPLEAKSVAKELGLSEESTSKLQQAYQEARRSQMERLREVTGGPGGGPGGRGGGLGNFQAIQQVNEAERGKLEAALKEFLTPEQTQKAMAVLGAFDRQYDRMTITLDGFGLDEEKFFKAMSLVNHYVASVDKNRREAAGGGIEGFREIREKTQALKAELDLFLAPILSEEQMKTWKEATAPLMGQGGRGPGGRGPGGGPGPGPGAPQN